MFPQLPGKPFKLRTKPQRSIITFKFRRNTQWLNWTGVSFVFPWCCCKKLDFLLQDRILPSFFVLEKRFLFWWKVNWSVDKAISWDFTLDEKYLKLKRGGKLDAFMRFYSICSDISSVVGRQWFNLLQMWFFCLSKFFLQFYRFGWDYAIKELLYNVLFMENLLS